MAQGDKFGGAPRSEVGVSQEVVVQRST
ncbi:putative receptor-type tyrosine-protein phosphatase N2, partial [Danaus plexippus plexippus]